MERLRFLSELAAELASSTNDYEAVLSLCARRLSERFGDLCIIRLISADGEFLEPSAAIHGPSPAVVEAARKATGTREPVGANPFIDRVLASGVAALVPQLMDPKVLADTTPERRELVAQLGITAFAIAPLVSQGKTIGAASLTRRGGKPYDDHDLRLLQDIAMHAALAIETARANRALVESSRAHQLLFEASPAPLFVYEVETLAPLAANEAALNLFGLTKDELMSRDISQLSADPQEVRWRVAALADEQVSGTARYVRKDGTVIVAEYRSRALDFGGTRARITALKDVTARFEADATRARLAAIVESSNDALVSCDLDGTVQTWNQAAERVFGRRACEMIGQPFSAVVPNEGREEDAAAIAHVARGEHFGPVVTTRARPDGAIVHVAVSVAPIRDADGNVVAVARTARDLTVEREAADALARTEAHLRQSQKMEAIGRLAGGVAHDFNNMLAVILSYCSVITEELAPGAPWRDEIVEIEHAATRAADLTRQLLLFSRQTVVAPKVMDLNASIRNMQKMLARILGEDIELDVVAAPAIGSVCADPGNVDQILLNLVVNARDAMPKGGKLVIKTREVVVGGEPFVALDVIDTGIGMDEATQARIFEPFFTTKAAGKGTGLGLATVFGVAQQAGGGVRVKSAPGRGATFTVYLPCVEARKDDEAAKASDVGPRGATILVVEDEPLVRNVAVRILRKRGFDVLVAPTPYEAIRICKEHSGPIDLLLTDVVMPHMSGPELASRVQTLRRETKVLCMSGYTDSTAQQAVISAGVPLLQKPFTPQTLTKKVCETLDPGELVVVH